VPLAEELVSDPSGLLRDLLASLAARRGQAAPSGDGDLLGSFALLREAWERQLPQGGADGVPPRRIGSSMVQAVFSQPHLVTVFGDYRGAATEEVSEPDRPSEPVNLLPTPEALESCFGLPQWELDDLRDEVDRRASRTLKQSRAGQVLWSRFRLPQAGPDPLFRALFPKARPPGRIGFVRRGAQLYVVCDQSPPADPSCVFQPWIAPPPLVFDAKAVDAATREEIGRGIGAADEETCELLAHMIAVVPRQGAIRHLAHDGWRSRGYAALSGLCPRYGASAWIARPVGPDEVDWSRWLTPREGRLEIGDADGYLVNAARQRAELATQATYAEMLARVTLEHPAEPILPDHEDLDLYDASAWLRTVLEPLVQWARAPATRTRIVTRTGLPRSVVDPTLDEVAGRWQGAIDARWCADHATSVAGTLVPHLALLHGSLRKVLRAVPDTRGHHREMLLLFAAHDLSESRLERLWPGGWADAGRAAPNPPDDVVGGWFWGAWTRLLTHASLDASTVF
jgi:hypothetical protein